MKMTTCNLKPLPWKLNVIKSANSYKSLQMNAGVAFDNYRWLTCPLVYWYFGHWSLIQVSVLLYCACLIMTLALKGQWYPKYPHPLNIWWYPKYLSGSLLTSSSTVQSATMWFRYSFFESFFYPKILPSFCPKFFGRCVFWWTTFLTCNQLLCDSGDLTSPDQLQFDNFGASLATLSIRGPF